jgi:D-lactate dehydrogenase (cytochrome)
MLISDRLWGKARKERINMWIMSDQNAVLDALKTILGADRVSAGSSDRELHSRDQPAHAGHLPDVVVWPDNTDQISRLAVYANEHSVPLTGWGAGSSLEGNPIPVCGGIVVDFSRMNRILEVYPEDFQVRVQPGVLYKDMNQVLAKYGLFFAPDPGANASIGGMVANNAAGTRTPKYGATRDNVLALEVVLASGEVLRTGSRSVKQSAGYDLTHLFLGSEGTLGLITEATLRLAPIPEHVSAAIASFPSTEAAAQAVFEIMGAGLGPAALELVNTTAVVAINQVEQLGLVEAPNLFLEFHGVSEASLTDVLNMAETICKEAGCQTYQSGLGHQARTHLWQARHRLAEILIRSHPGLRYAITDVAVPISQYPALVSAAQQALEKLSPMDSYIVGHAGDGNMHTTTFYDDTVEQHTLVENFIDQLVEHALRLGGTCTGEHGVGIGKRKYMQREHGEAALQTMQQIKHLLDPKGILNPRKILL